MGHINPPGKVPAKISCSPDEPATEEGAGAVEDTGGGGIGGTEETSVEDVEGAGQLKSHLLWMISKK